MKVHLSGACSRGETAATGFHMYWAETQGLRPHPSGTASIWIKEESEYCKTTAVGFNTTPKKKNPTKDVLTTTYLTNSFYIEVFPLAIKELFVLSEQQLVDKRLYDNSTCFRGRSHLVKMLRQEVGNKGDVLLGHLRQHGEIPTNSATHLNR